MHIVCFPVTDSKKIAILHYAFAELDSNTVLEFKF